MTEAEWLACPYPQLLVEVLSDKASERKLRLFAVACCRRMGDLVWDDALDGAVERAERFADGQVSKATLRRAWDKVDRLRLDWTKEPQRCHVKDAVWWVANPDLLIVAQIADCAMRAVADTPGKSNSTLNRRRRRESTAQADLLRDIFGNPFRPAKADPRWLTSTAVALAGSIYAERAFDRLPILADALEDAGCDDAGILAHLRGDGPHVRGCWALDLVLGKS